MSNYEGGMTLAEITDAIGVAIREKGRDAVVPLGFSDPHSYRGYYECLAFNFAENVTLGAMLEAALSADLATYEGWKGGYYVMQHYTECFVTDSSGAAGDPVTKTVMRLIVAAAKVGK